MNPIIIPASAGLDYDGWVIVMNSAEAQLYGGKSPIGDIEHICSFVNAAGRQPESNLTSDREGRAFDSQGAGRHAMEGASAYETTVKRFVAMLGDAIKEATDRLSINHLVVSAPPKILGEVKNHWPEAVQQRVSCFLNKDLVNTPPSRIRAYLPDRLWSSMP